MSPARGKKRRSDSSSSSSSDSSSSSNDHKKSKHSSSGESSDVSNDKSKKTLKKQDDKYKTESRRSRSRDRHNRSHHRDHSDNSENDNKKKQREENRYRKNDEVRYQRNYEDERHGRNNRGQNARKFERRENNRGGRDRHQDNDSEDRYRNFDRDRRSNRGGRRNRSRSKSFDHSRAKWGREDTNKPKTDNKSSTEKQKPNFGLSGKLTEETNTYQGVVIKYSEPPEARKAKRRWRLYPFKGDKALQTLYIHRESAYLIGRDRKVVDLPVDHPSCSKQHAALQYRLVPFTRDDGSAGKRVRPYLIDLESANGTFINNKKIDPKKYVELLERDVIKFGFSSREYVLLHENSKDETQDDDVKIEEEEVEVKKEKNE